jgi:hypothetical protein
MSMDENEINAWSIQPSHTKPSGMIYEHKHLYRLTVGRWCTHPSSLLHFSSYHQRIYTTTLTLTPKQTATTIFILLIIFFAATTADREELKAIQNSFCAYKKTFKLLIRSALI